MNAEYTVKLNEGQIALIGLIFMEEYWNYFHRIGGDIADLAPEDPTKTATKLEVMAEIIKALGIEDGGDIGRLAAAYREWHASVIAMPDTDLRKALILARWKERVQ